MNAFVNYIIESGLSLGLLALVYFAFLRNETYFKANRLFLLFSVLFSSILPLLHLKVNMFGNNATVISDANASSNLLEGVTVFSSGISRTIADFVTTSNLVVFGYLSVVLISALLFALRIVQIMKVIRKGRVVEKQRIKYVYTDGNSSPFSFLNYLFVSQNMEKNPNWEKMLAHELEHIRQGHTVDILILELISLFQWFNPFFWLMRRVIKQNHEYMADNAVLNKGVAVDTYKRILVSQWVGTQFSVTNNFNSSLIKSRLKMMTKIKSSKLAGLRYLSGGIMVLALLFVFACENKDDLQTPEEQSALFTSDILNGANPVIFINDALSSNDAMDKLNPEDIKSISVLKGASADVEKYGDNAKNGVILISLKDGATDAENNNIGEVAVVGYGTNGIQSTDQVFNIVEDMPEFPGGEEALRTFIAQSVKYPVIAQTNGIQGKVYVNFVVEKDGSVGRLKVVRGVDSSLDYEALRVASSMPKWKAGKQRGENVAVSYTIPINFVLQ